MAKHNEFGKLGEQKAMELLLIDGYIIRECNWRSGKMELDIIAEKNGRIVFVEVKSRTTDMVNPTDSVNRTKILNLVRAANAYVNANNITQEIQFDIITLIGSPESFEIEHIPDAFLAPIKVYN